MTDDRPTDERPAEGRWLSYTEAAQLLGISSEALRSLARRHQWDRRSPNAIGGQAWVLVPEDRLPTNGRGDSNQRSATDDDRQRPAEQPTPTNGREPEDQWSDLDADRPIDRREDRRLDDILIAVREMAEMLMGPVREQLADLKAQLAAEQKRGDHYEDQAALAKRQVQLLQEKLDDERDGHRKVVTLLTEQLATRRSWWRWRR